MLQQLFDYLKSDLDTLKKDVKEDMHRLETKIDEMLRFKWQIMGGTVVVSAILGIIVQILISLVAKHG